ncbi:MAG: hypothetical protein PWR24_768 [Desulfonauticus sp.]|jgi:SAM-dependent methyltransferase|nr:hypothetical protein [Desulfonauticus sp.]
MEKEFVYIVKGYCPICEKKVQFKSNRKWLRDNYLCEICGSIPRERALMYVLKQIFGYNYTNLIIHESSPIDRGTSLKLKKECKSYIQSHFFPDKKDKKNGDFYNIDLQNQWFDSEQFDCVITQDVMEHLPNPELALKEIYRTLKKGGYYIFTVPLVNKFNNTLRWADIDAKGNIVWYYSEEYHGNPINSKGSPVFWHFGYDITHLIRKWEERFVTIIFSIENKYLGIEGEYNEVIVCKK